MPLYEYECKDCRHCFESLILKNDAPRPPCPKCGGNNVSRLMSSGSFRAQGIPGGAGGFKPSKCASS